jgi:hypothetical protein
VQRPNPVSVAGLARLVPVGLGLAFGLWFVLTSPYKHAPLWPVWAPFLVAFTTAAGAVFPYGLDRWAELSTDREVCVHVRDAVPRVTAIAAVALLGVVGSTRPPVAPHSSWRHVALISFLIVGGVPAFGVMEGVRHATVDQSAASTRGAQVAVLVSLRQLLQRLLAAVGSLVALSTLAVGSSVVLEQNLPAGTGDVGAARLPPQFVLVFGGLGSLLVALFYVPTATALQRRGQALCDELFPLREADEAPVILSVAEDRHKLEQLLGVDRGVVADLQSGLAILGPLLAGAAAAFLSPHA